MNRIRAVKNTIWKNEFDVRAARAEVEKKSSTAVEKLREKQEELFDFITKRIEELKKNVVDHKTEVLAKLDQEIGVLEENIAALDALEDQLSTDEHDNLEFVRKVEQDVKRNQTDIIYRYLEYYDNTVPIFDLNKLCGHLRQEERWVSQSSESGLTRPRAKGRNNVNFYVILELIRGGSRISRRRGAPSLQGNVPTYTFSQKLHEIKKIFVRRGGSCSGGAPLGSATADFHLTNSTQ